MSEEEAGPKFRKEFEDKRGVIYVLDGLFKKSMKGDEINYLEIKRGAGRGACYHTNDEYFVVYQGMIEYIHGRESHSLTTEVVSRGESRRIPAGEIHAFVGLEDSIVSEWGITTEEKKLDIKDPKLRVMIDELNNRLE